MKTPMIGIVAAAILTVVAGVGIGVALAGETHTIGEFMEWQTVDQGSSQGSSSDAYNADALVETGNSPEPSEMAQTHAMGEFMEWQTVDQADSSSPYSEDQPVLSFDDEENLQMATLSQEFVPEGNWSGTDWQISGPAETGNLPDTGNLRSPVPDDSYGRGAYGPP
jgi:hypothetical protein